MLQYVIYAVGSQILNDFITGVYIDKYSNQGMSKM